MDEPLHEWIAALASATPAPAAGSAAALSLSQGAALGVMAVRFAQSRHSDAERQSALAASRQVLERVAASGLSKIEEDCRAVTAMVAYFKSARASTPAPSSMLDEAMDVPFSILSLSLEGLVALDNVIELVNATVLCEAGTSASSMWTAAQSSYWIVSNNAAWLRARKDWSGTVEEARAMRASALRSYESTCRVVSTGVERTT